MKCSFVTDYKAILECVQCAIDLYEDFDMMEDYNFDAKQCAEYIHKYCWFVSFHDEVLRGFILLEFLGDSREANLHFVKLDSGSILSGWRMFLDLIENEVSVLHAYIDIDKRSVVNVAKRLGFEFDVNNQNKRYAHGKRRISS
jgi:hypothetical protein